MMLRLLPPDCWVRTTAREHFADLLAARKVKAKAGLMFVAGKRASKRSKRVQIGWA
jgi:hypothetical protein